MKSRQVTALLLSAIMTVSACMPMNGISAFAAENTGAGSTETAAVVEPESEDTEEPEEQPVQEQEETVEVQAEEPAAEESAEPEAEEESAEPEEEQAEESVEPEAEPEAEQAEESAEPEAEAEKPEADSQTEEETEETLEVAPEEQSVQKSDMAAEEEPTLTAYIAGEEMGVESKSLNVPAGETVDLEVIAEVSNGDEPTYEWYCNSPCDLENVNGSTLRTAPAILNETVTYTCEVSNYYTDPIYLYFYVNGIAVDEHENVSFDTAEVISSGDTKEVTVSADKPHAYYKFTPDTTGKYLFYAEAGYDTFGVLYDSSEQEIISNDEFNGNSFCIKYELTAGETYYYLARLYNESNEGTFNVYLKKTTLKVEGENSETRYVDPGEEITLNVIAQSQNAITYTWFVDDNTVECDGDSYTFTPDSNCNVRCEVSDGEETENRYFSVVINSNLTALPEGAEDGDHTANIYVSPNEGATLKVNATADDTSQLTYNWYDKNNERIEGAEGNTYVIESATASGYYWCNVSDQYGNSAYVYFHIFVENHLTALPEGDGDHTANIYVSPNEGATLKVNATADDTSQLTYNWYDKNNERIEGAEGNTYVIESATASGYYWCNVSDQYGNTDDVFFWVNIENHLTALPEGAEDGDHTANIYVSPNEGATLKVNATADDTSQLTYSWYDNDGNTIEGAEDNTYEIESATASGDYRCRVSDRYGNTDDVYFRVNIENHLTAAPEGAEDGENYAHVYVSPNEGATLKVNATADDTSQLTYSWYDNVGNTIEGAVDNTYEIESVTSREYYECRVSDRYGNDITVFFYVYVQNNLTVKPEGGEDYTDYADLYVLPNEEVTLKVNVTADDIEQLTYHWTDEYGNTIEGAEGNTYVIESATKSGRYECTVSDRYGNSQSACFFVYVENHLTATPEGADDEPDTAYIYVSPNEEVTLKVNATADDDTQLTYTWCYSNYSSVEGAEGDTYVIESATASESYLCIVSDKYGNNSTAYFNVYIQNHLTVVPEGAEDGEDRANKYVSPKEEVTLKVNATADDASQLTYSWYYEDSSNYEEWHTIEEAEGNTCVIESVTTKGIYHCRVSDQYGNREVVDFYVYVENHLVAVAKGGAADEPTYAQIYISPNEEVTLKVNVTADDTSQITYRWFDYNGEPIEGVDGDTYELGPVNCYNGYTCTVEDQYGNSENLYFTVTVQNHLKATAEGTDSNYVDIELSPNEAATLKVNVTADDTSELTYTWFKGDQEIEGAETDTFETEALTAGATYSCKIKDQYGNAENVEFYIEVDNHLRVLPEGSDGSDSSYLYVALNEEVTLKVNASADDKTDLTYRWYENDELIDGADTDTYAAGSGTKFRYYKCEVEDLYGNTAYAHFYIYIQNHLEAEIEDEYEEEVDYLSLSVTPGDELILKVKATADDTEQLTYTWYNTVGQEIEGINSDTYKPGDKIQRGTYKCCITDRYDNTRELSFCILIDNNLSAVPEGAKANDEYVHIDASPNEEVTMKVNVTAIDSENLTYEWYDDNDELIEGADTDSCVVTAKDKSSHYHCEVQDKYGNDCSAWFNIEVGGLTVVPDGSEENDAEAYLNVAPNEEVTLKVNATADDGGQLTYTWYDADGNKVGSDSDTYVTGAMTTETFYRCIVNDQYGNTGDAYFYIYVGHLTVAPEGAEEDRDYTIINVAPNDEVTLNVLATTDTGSKLTYTWHNSNYDVIEGAASASYEVGPVTGYDYYYCIVKDQYGNSDSARFYIRANHLTAAPVADDIENDNWASIYVPLNGAATLQVTASADDTSKLTYTWYDDDWKEIEGANGTTYSIDSVTKYSTYHCEVGDSYDNHREVHFKVGVRNNLVVTPEGGSAYSDVVTLYANPDQEVTLKVNATADDTSQLKYAWYDNDYKKYGANGPSLVIRTGLLNAFYRCYVKDQYGNSKEINFEIIIGQSEFQTQSEVTLDQESYVYDGNEHKPSVKVVYKGTELVSGTDYTITYSDDVTNAGTKNVTITGLGQYEGTIVKTYKITKASQTLTAEDLSVEVGQSGKITVSGGKTDVTFTSSDEAVATVSADGTVTGVKTGTATITATAAGNDNYSAGSTEVNVTVTGIDISAGEVTLSEEEFTYDGEEHKPGVKVALGGSELVSGTDYEAAFSDDVTSVGVKTVTVTGIGNYSGELTKTYEIKKAAQTISADDVSVEFGGTGKIEVSGAQGDVTFTSSDEAVATVSADGTVTGKKAGTAAITVAAAGNENYNAGSIEVNVTVTAIDISAAAAATLSETEFTYSGEAQKPEVTTVTYDGNALTSGTDYDVTFPEDCTNAGEKNVTISFKGNYSGKIEKTYEIKKADQTISAGDVSVAIGKSAQIDLSGAQGDVTYASTDEEVATVSADGTVTGKNAGTATITVAAAGNDNYNAGSAEVTVTVSNLDIKDAEVTLTPAAFTYNGEVQKPEVKVVYNGEELTAETDYVITFSEDVTNAGTKKVTITGNGEYAGVIEKTYEIAKASQTLSAIDISLEVGKSGKIEVSGAQNSVTFASSDEAVATVSEDGTVTGVKAGTVTVTATAAGDNNYSEASAQITVTISAIDISDPDKAAVINVALSSTAFTYNGTAQKPTVTVTYDGTALTSGTDYEVTFPDDITNAGEKNVTIKFTGNYDGVVTNSYTIAKAAQPVTASLSAAKIVVGATSKVNISGTKESAKLTYATSNAAVATVSAAGVVTAKKVGTAKITVTAAATKNYNAASRQVTVSVLPGATAKLTAAAAANGKGIKLTWTAVAGATQYQVYRNNKLIKTTGNVVTYTDTGANTNGTKYTFKIVAKASTGVSTLSKSAVYYKVNRPAVKKLTNSASKKMTVKWAKNAKATGYEIQYGLKKNFKGAKTAKVTKKATVSKTISKLTKGKTYYVRIRTYKKVGKVTYYSAWSAAKSVKIKK